MDAQPHAQDTTASRSKAAKRTRTKANTNNDSSSASLPTASATASSVKPTTSHKKRKKKPASKSSTPVAAASSSEEVAAESAPKAKLKVVVRRLPPNVPEAVVWQAVAPWVREEHAQPTVDWKAFVQGKLKDSSRPGTSNDPKAVAHVHSRAYIHFLSLDYLLDFHRNFDGHVFRDAKGNEHTALVEFAPHQKVPVEAGARRKKPDPRQGTIDEDAHYVEFLASLHEKAAETDDAQTTAEKTDAQLMAHMASRSAEASLNAAKARQTPLLEHLRAQRAGRTESSALAAARDYLTRSNAAYNVVSTAPTSDKLGKKKKKKDKASALATARSTADDVGSASTAATLRPLAGAVAAAPATTGGEEATGAVSSNKKKGTRQSKSEVSDARAPDAPSSSASAANAQRGPKAKTAANKSAASASKGKFSDGVPQGDVKVSGGGKTAKKQKAAPQRQAPSAAPPAPAPIAILKRAEPAPSQAAPKPVPAPVAEASIPTGPRADNRGAANGRGRGAGRRGGKSSGRGGKAAVVASSSSAGA